MGELLGWLRKLPAYAVAVLVLVVIIAIAGIGYFIYATSGGEYLTGRTSAQNREQYQWDGGPLVLQSASSDRSANCYIQPKNGERRSVHVPRTRMIGFANMRDYVELSGGSGPATIACNQSVKVYSGASEISRVKSVNSALFGFGFPALIAIPIIALLFIGGARKAGSSSS